MVGGPAAGLEEKVSRLFWVAVHGPTADAPHPDNRAAFGVDTPAAVVRAHRPGGVVLFTWSGNTEHPDQVAQLTADLHAAAAEAGHTLGIAIDEEGGRVSRVGPPATVFPSARAVAAAGHEQLAVQRWTDAGAELAAIGVTVNLAPVVDLGHPPNPVLGDRTFADDPETVAAQAALAVRGLARGGVAAVAKHFPGHGATTVDSHAGLPIVDLAREELEPHIDAFRRLFATQPPAGVMTAHLLVRALDEGRPATLSPAVLTDLLRTELGYTGAVLTDSLAMAGIRTQADDADVAVGALAAGADVLLTPPDLRAAVTAVCRAVRSGRITEERVDEALARAAPLARGGERADPTDRPLRAIVGHPDHRARAAEIARRALRVAADPRGRLPLRDGPLVVVGAAGSGARALADALRGAGRPATLLEIAADDDTGRGLDAAGQARPDGTAAASEDPDTSVAAALASAARDATLVLVRRVPELDAAPQDRVLGALARDHARVVLVDTGATPAPWTGGLDLAVLLTHGACATAVTAAATALVGRVPPA